MVGKPGNETRNYPDFVNLFTYPHIALGAVSEEEEEEEEECEANPCTITETELKTVEWVQCDGCARWYHLNCLGLQLKTINDSWYCSMC